jgi:hypothetical protein
MEADIICSKLVEYGITDYCLGNDMDLLAFGCPRVIRNMSFRDDTFNLFDYSNILNKINLSHSEFVDMCIVIGCDYAAKPLGIKPLLAYELISKYRNIENIIQHIATINYELDLVTPGKHIKLPPYFDYESARHIFHISHITLETITDLISEQSFSTIYSKCHLIINNKIIYNNLFTFCKTYCPGINNGLITKKLHTICNISDESEPVPIHTVCTGLLSTSSISIGTHESRYSSQHPFSLASEPVNKRELNSVVGLKFSVGGTVPHKTRRKLNF